MVSPFKGDTNPNILFFRTNGRDHPLDLLAPNTDHNHDNKGGFRTIWSNRIGNVLASVCDKFLLFSTSLSLLLISLSLLSISLSLFSAYFMWASAVLGSPGSDTELSSPKINLKDKICFTFWLDMTVCFTKYIILINQIIMARRYHLQQCI